MTLDGSDLNLLEALRGHMSMPAFLEAAGLRIPITDWWGGPELAIIDPLEPLVWVVNHWIRGKFPELLDHVEQGKDAMRDGFGAGRPYPEDITEERTAVWRNLTGRDVGDDAVLVGSPMNYESFLLPRHALVEILHAVARVRAEAAMRPRLPSALTQADRAITNPRPAQLFTQTPTNQPPFEEERVALGDLENLAVALDVAQASTATEDDRAHIATKRRQLVDQLERHGLLDEVRAHEKRAYLEGFRLPTLRDYVDAAMAMRAYYRGPTRATYNLGPPPPRLLGGDVSLDWFRIPRPAPEGMTRDSWLATAEQLLRESPREEGAGEIFTSVAGRHYRIYWRTDHDRPAIVAAQEPLR